MQMEKLIERLSSLFRVAPEIATPAFCDVDGDTSRNIPFDP
jgi:hypothetical protein